MVERGQAADLIDALLENLDRSAGQLAPAEMLAVVETRMRSDLDAVTRRGPQRGQPSRQHALFPADADRRPLGERAAGVEAQSAPPQRVVGGGRLRQEDVEGVATRIARQLQQQVMDDAVDATAAEAVRP